MTLIADMRVALALLIISIASLQASVSTSFAQVHSPSPVGRDRSQQFEASAFLDANQIGMFISNNGSLVFNQNPDRSSPFGFFFPVDSALGLMQFSGLWLYAEKSFQRRVDMVYWTRSEFTPGPNPYDPIEDSSVFRPYKITSADTLSPSEDWLEWPVDWGAPLDNRGRPLLTGDQSIWTIFNDGDPTKHTVNGGKTPPLNVQVHLYAYAYRNFGLLDNAVFLNYRFTNKSGTNWRDFVAGLWSDPDIGFYGDDKGGTDSSLSMAYCYTLEGDSELPPDFLPVVGTMMLESPSTLVTGRTAASASSLRNLYYSRSVDSTLNILSGLTPDGFDYIDPTTGNTTHYPYGGDPRTGNGWLDSGKGDRQLMVSSVPVSFNQSDTLTMNAAFIAASGSSIREAVSNFYDVAHAVYDFHQVGLNGLIAEKNVHDGTIQSVEFEPVEQTWFTGHDWGGSALNGGIGFAGELWGSSLDKSENVDVEFLFSADSGQIAARFVEEGGVYRFADEVEVPFLCRRLTDSAEVNVILIDYDDSGGWSVSFGTGADIVIVTKSSRSEQALSYYEGRTFPSDALGTDLMYAVSLDVLPGHERRNIRSGQRLQIRVVPEEGASEADTVRFGAVAVGLSKSVSISFRDVYTYDKGYSMYLDPPRQFKLSRSGFAIAGQDTEHVRIMFTPIDTVEYAATLTVVADDFNKPVRRIVLTGRGAVWPLAGDMRPDGSLDLVDVVAFIRYLYNGFVLPEEKVELDLDGSGSVSLTDLVVLIGTIFSAD